ncbi:MAG: methionine adenosyltransferase domain-containing protein [Nitrospinae bacterium]|nr:methionine adenosyltransferase domain-containing protein [Nitrospinota bacterium]
MRKARAMACEFVTPGHPDKVCDQMADAILDAAMAVNPLSRVAMEVTGGHGLVAVIGEMNMDPEGKMKTRPVLDIGEIVRKTYADIGHDHPLGVFVNVVVQSPDIAKGVNETQGKEQGAGDQGIMVGYAVNDGRNCMPKTWTTARMLCERMRELREHKILPYLRPDGKSQVTMAGDRVTHVTLAAHYSEDDVVAHMREARSDDATLAQIRKALDQLRGERLDHLREDRLDDTGRALLRQIRASILAHVRNALIAHAVRHVVPDLSPNSIVVNGTGRFVQGGFDADAGTTGRKLMVDNYGPNVEVGGGCYSGKDPSKVDRSAAYFCRMVAKSIVAGGHANEAIVKVAFAIGQEEPTLISVETDLPEAHAVKLEQKVGETFDFRPKAMIERLGLLRPEGWCYRDIAAAGHYGDDRFPWEQVVPL